MHAFEFSLPVRIVYGAGKLGEVGKVVAAYGKHCLVVCDPFFTASGLAARVVGLLGEAGVKAMVYDRVIPNPTTVVVDGGAAVARAAGCDVVLGLGGGSSMDTAKGIAVAATHEGSIWPYAIGEKPISSGTLPVVTVTTTSGTGSQCTCFSVITNPATNQKPGMGSPHILPRASIIDPELMLSVPRKMTLITGFDVFSHAVEALTSKVASPMSDLFAEKALELTALYLPRCAKDGNDLDARGGMALADTYAGIAICHAVVTIGHVIAHVISGHYHDIAHGEALYSIYREVLGRNSVALPEKHRFIAGQLVPGCDDPVTAFGAFFGPFGFENKLKAKRPDDRMIRLMAEETFTYMKGIADLNPVELNSGDAEAILRNSLVHSN